MFVTTARVAPEKQEMPACLPMVSSLGCERVVMYVFNQYHARVINSLRRAARNNGDVLELLRVLAASNIQLDALDCSERDKCFLQAATFAHSFASLDANQEEY